MKERRIRVVMHEGQSAFIRSQARFKALACGRRWGKTLIAVMYALRKLRESGIIGWWVAPTFPLTMKGWRETAKLLTGIGEPHRGELYWQLPNGSAFWFKSAENPDSLLSEGLDFVVLDEAARIKREAWERALRPALTDRLGEAIFVTTPKGRNWFWETWMRGEDGDADYASWRFPTSANPHIAPEEIEQARETLPVDVFRQEYLAEFLEHAAAVFRDVEGRVQGELEEPQADRRYVMGVDLAKRVDWTVIVIMDQDRRHVVAFDRLQGLAWPEQKARIRALADKYRATVLVDSTGLGDPIFDDLRMARLNIEGFQITADSKQRLVQLLAMAFEREGITFPKIPVLVEELKAFGYEILSSGKVRYQAPEGRHDDCVIALALANWAAERRMAGVPISSDTLVLGRERITAGQEW